MAAGSNSSIVQIGAVRFDRESGRTHNNVFKVNIELQSCIDLGLRVEGSTLMWWMSKPKYQQDGIFQTPRLTLTDALLKFNFWLMEYNEVFEIKPNDLSLWGRSPRFDIGILHDAYKVTKLPVIWDFRKEMCVRTLEAIAPDIKSNHDEINKSAYSHDTVEDCLHQIGYITQIWTKRTIRP